VGGPQLEVSWGKKVLVYQNNSNPAKIQNSRSKCYPLPPNSPHQNHGAWKSFFVAAVQEPNLTLIIDDPAKDRKGEGKAQTA
jgi:hypothetical protein